MNEAIWSWQGCWWWNKWWWWPRFTAMRPSACYASSLMLCSLHDIVARLSFMIMIMMRRAVCNVSSLFLFPPSWKLFFLVVMSKMMTTTTRRAVPDELGLIPCSPWWIFGNDQIDNDVCAPSLLHFSPAWKTWLCRFNLWWRQQQECFKPDASLVFDAVRVWLRIFVVKRQRQLIVSLRRMHTL